MSVILINPFEVAAEQADEFLRSWGEARDYMKRQPGFITTKLHRAVRPDARFGFVNIAEWESPEDFMEAVQSPEFQKLAQGSPPNFPALYEIVQVDASEGGE